MKSLIAALSDGAQVVDSALAGAHTDTVVGDGPASCSGLVNSPRISRLRASSKQRNVVQATQMRFVARNVRERWESQLT